MSNNYWPAQNNQHDPAEATKPPHKAGLLSNYVQQQQGQPSSAQRSTVNGPTSREIPSSLSHPQKNNLPPGSQADPPAQTQWNGAFITGPTQIIKRWSNKMASMRRTNPSAAPGPRALYHSAEQQSQPLHTTLWKRSHTQRVAYLRKRRQKRQPHGPHSWRIAKILLAVLVALFIVMITSTAGYAYKFYRGELPHLQNLANMRIPQSTRIYDRHGTLLYTLYANGTWGESGRSTPISYNYLPRVLQDAQTSAEDPTFWTNNGIDPQGMLRALTAYFSHGGQIAGGGSTMTQQLIKNLSANMQDTIQRKASEASLAIGLTQQYPKWKIMEMYFNDTPYGAQEKGIEAAVEDYFGLVPQCNANHTQCIPGVAFLDRDLTACKITTPQIDETSCKQDKMLALARAVLLAGIPQNPTHFDPSVSQANFQNVLTNRVPYVLEQMVQNNAHLDLGLGANTEDEGVITSAMIPQVEAIISKMHILGFQPNMLAPHFVNWVIQTLSNELGHGDYDAGYTLLENSGMNIYTTLDLNLEQFVEKDVRYNLRDKVYEPYTGYGPLNTVYNVNDSAVVVMDAKTGEILAMDGSANYNDPSAAVGGQVNAALAYRQPGSSIKPIIYATALEKGWYPGIKLLDSKTYFPNGSSQADSLQDSTYTPTDYMQSYHPYLPTDIRISLQNSFNIPAIKALMYSGIDSVADMARRLGITALDQDLAVYNAQHPKAPNTLSQLFGPSMALGTPGIPLVQMVGAYQVFANNGVRVPQHNILDIWDNYGRNLYHYDPTHPNSVQVLSPQITFLLNNMLSDNASRHYEFQGIDTLTLADLPDDPPVAAKTGTTDAFLDNWTIGYTPHIVTGVWSGNANGNNPMRGVIGVSGAGPIWQDVMEYANGLGKLGMKTDLNYQSTAFPQPGGIVQAPVNSINGLQGTGVTDWMINGEQPQQTGLIACNTTDDNGDPNSWQNSAPLLTPTPSPNSYTGDCPNNGSGSGTGSNNPDGQGSGNTEGNGDANGNDNPNGGSNSDGNGDGNPNGSSNDNQNPFQWGN